MSSPLLQAHWITCVCKLCNENFSLDRSVSHAHTRAHFHSPSFVISIEIKLKAGPGSEMCLPELTRFTSFVLFFSPRSNQQSKQQPLYYQQCFAPVVFIKFAPPA